MWVVGWLMRLVGETLLDVLLYLIAHARL